MHLCVPVMAAVRYHVLRKDAPCAELVPVMAAVGMCLNSELA